MKTFISAAAALLLFSTALTAQLYQGPDTGSVASGVVMSTGSAELTEDMSFVPFPVRPLRNKIPVLHLPDEQNAIRESAPAGSNVREDKSLAGRTESADDPFIMRSYQGFLDQGNYIPPDDYLAAGPNHVISVDNGRFRIWSKTGTLQKSVNIDSWFGTTLSGASPFDCKVTYDHFAKRWVQVWLHQNDGLLQGYFLISVSDDSNPHGTWYNWAIPSSLNGATPSSGWGDYQGVGIDQNAIYLTTNQFSFAGSYQGSKIRIVPKAQLYANTGGRCQWTDLWDVRDPVNNTQCFGIRPVIVYDNQNYYYFLSQSRYTTGNYVTLFRLSDPLGTPTMTANNISVTTYYAPPNSNQLGTTTTIDAGGTAAFRCEPIVRGRYMWAVHPVYNYGWSGVSYLRIDLNTNLKSEDYVFAANNYYYSYPAIAVDRDSNIVISYSRSSDGEYIGAFFTGKAHNATEFLGSYTMQAGKAVYVKTFGGSRNRWGDYNGAWLDPADETSFWICSEYAETPDNTWAVWNMHVRLFPVPGIAMHTFADTLSFRTTEVGYTGDTLSMSVIGIGSTALTIDSVTFSDGDYSLVSSHAFPLSLNYQDSAAFRVSFNPSSPGLNLDYMYIHSNDAGSPKAVPLKSKAYVIHPVTSSVIYGVTGTQASGAVITVNHLTGAGTLLGSSGLTELRGVSIRPSTGDLWGTFAADASNTDLYRINAQAGDAYKALRIPYANIRGLAFDGNDILYLAASGGTLYRYDFGTNSTTVIGATAISNLYGLAINPLNGQLWGVSLNNKIYRIDKTSGASTQVGVPGFATTPDIVFDQSGNLFGLAKFGTQVGELIRIDTATGVGTLIGVTTFKSLNGIAVTGTLVGIDDRVSSEIPKAFSLYPCYPNPFNPATTITYDVAKAAKVRLTVYNVLGQEIRTLVNARKNAGKFQVVWDGRDNAGHAVASGIYMYRIEAGSYVKSMKMMLMK